MALTSMLSSQFLLSLLCNLRLSLNPVKNIVRVSSMLVTTSKLKMCMQVYYYY